MEPTFYYTPQFHFTAYKSAAFITFACSRSCIVRIVFVCMHVTTQNPLK